MKAATQTEYAQRVLRVQQHIEGRLAEDLSPQDLAEVAGFSLHHFHRVFRGMTDESVMGYVRRLRLERAAQRLKYGESTVTEVAFSAGYGSHEAFTRAFSASFGRSPSAYRDEAVAAFRNVPIVLRDEPPRRVLALRHRGAYEACFPTWDQLMDWANERQLAEGRTPDFGLCYDDPEVTDDDRVRYDVCVAAPERPVECPADIVARTVPGGRYAVATHHGPYETINDSYVALIGKWLPRRGVELHNEPVLEVYLRGPDTAPPGDLVTEICVRIR